MSATELFRDAMRKAGIEHAGNIAADGKLHRFKAGEDREPNSWCVLYDGAPAAGAFGCWKRQASETWCAKSDRECSAAEKKLIRANWKRADQERKRAEAERHTEARDEAGHILSLSTPAGADHAYIIRKGIKPSDGLREHEGRLVIPLRDTAGTLHSLQTVAADGSKRFMPGGRVSGCFYSTGRHADWATLIICEGYATGATIHEATGHAVVCAMNCGNLLAVAKALRKQWPNKDIIIAADNDQFTEGNPGLTKATEAANTIGAKLLVPQFKNTTSKPTDFNDLHQMEGIELVQHQLGSSTTPTETDAECFARLAKLSPADFDRCRKEEATRMNIRTETLDKEVVAMRRDVVVDDDKRSAEPWDSPVDGAELLHLIATTYERFCVLPNHASKVLAVWVLQSYCYRWFDFAGVIAVWSPEPACGKGRVLDVTSVIASNPFRTSNTSAAVLYHQVSKGDITVLIDEVDSHSEDKVSDISNILKSGFQSNGTAHRMADINGAQTVVEFSTFCPKMIAAITLDSLDKATRSRSISVRMNRKPRESRIEKFRRFDETEIRRKCLRWVADNEATVKSVGFLNMDECATDRQEDIWEPLVAIARVAGGDWESRIRDAARQLSGAATAASSDSVAHQLLEAVKGYFDSNHVTKVGTKQLIGALNEGGDFTDCNRGRGLTPAFLAGKLGPYGVSTRTLRSGGDTFKGYDMGDFESAFASYLTGGDVSERHNVTTLGTIEQNPVFNNVTKVECDVSENTVPTNGTSHCDVVTFQKAKTVGEEEKARGLEACTV